MKLLEKHKEFFTDIDKLYPYQEEVINHLYGENNTLAIIPTGGGKSMIYQLYALELPGITIVISPLIALMKDQVDDLQKRGIKALAFNSDITFNEQREIIRNIANSDIKLLYLSPERLQNGIFKAGLAASGVKISMIVIDEAHCISQWGQGFRPEYAQIPPFLDFLNDNHQKPQILALTATLARAPRKAIKKYFKIDDRYTYIPKTIIRDNLTLTFQKVEKEKDKAEALQTFLEQHQPTKVLAYFYSRLKCEEFSNSFAELGYNTGYYHSGLEREQKDLVFDKYKSGEIDMLFTTTAFGMGINIPDIDAVVHMQMPHCIEEYYQHVGRGWRDKKMERNCHCLLLWSEVNAERRKEDLKKEILDLEALHLRINKLLGKRRKSGKVVFKDKEEYLNSSENLQLIRYKLEKAGLINTIGEINGSPLTIKMKDKHSFWERILDSLDGMDSFGWASQVTGISINEMIDFIYEQEFNNRIEKLPAMRRDLYFEINIDPFPTEILEAIVNEINDAVHKRLKDLEDLRELFVHENPELIISKHLSG
ncbi:MAG: RecQ family ATP-dependent DNA helicase [Cyclobacteriaceae bacterium]